MKADARPVTGHWMQRATPDRSPHRAGVEPTPGRHSTLAGMGRGGWAPFEVWLTRIERPRRLARR
jgi:hypothetical protein